MQVQHTTVDDWVPVCGTTEGYNTHSSAPYWKNVDVAQCTAHDLRRDGSIKYRGALVHIAHRSNFHWARQVASVVSPDIVRCRMYVQELSDLAMLYPSIGTDFLTQDGTALRVVVWIVLVHKQQFIQAMRQNGTFTGSGALTELLYSLQDSMHAQYPSPMNCIDREIVQVNGPVVSSPMWGAHPLLPEQEQSVRWMQDFEQRIVNGENEVHFSKVIPLPDLGYVLMPTLSTYARHRAVMIPEEKLDESDTQTSITYRGGILADKTGSGKTAITIALILSTLHLPMPSTFHPDLLMRLSRIPVQASLVVVPINLSKQWMHEIAKFASASFSVVTIFNKRDYQRVSVTDILNCQLVLTSVNFLVGKPYNDVVRRIAANYTRVPSFESMQSVACRAAAGTLTGTEPVLFQNFWWRRVVYDEVHEQLVLPASHDRRSQILRDIQGVVHWGLSGTPNLHNITESNIILRMTSRESIHANSYAASRIISACVRRSPHVSNLPPLIQEEHWVTITDRERALLESHRSRGLPDYIKLCTCFSVLALHGQSTAELDEALASMTFEEIARMLVERRTTEITYAEEQLVTVRSTAALHQQLLDTAEGHASQNNEHPAAAAAAVDVDDEDESDGAQYNDDDDDDEDNNSDNARNSSNVYRGLRRSVKLAVRRVAEHEAQLASLVSQRNFFRSQLGDDATTTCPICLTAAGNVITKCGHWYCKPCILQYIGQRAAAPCPVCKQMVPKSGWIEVVAHPVNVVVEPPVELSDAERYGSKLAEIVHTLQEIKARGEKAIMFVQWVDLMRSVRAILSKGGVNAVAIMGNTNTRNAALDRLQRGDMDVLLMSLDTSTAGLNLIEANHVIFAHPVLGGSPTTKQDRISQAVGRVHRMGQTRPVTVHWFVTENTDEQAVYFHE